ncbi:GNAT family N-acetyltransferase [Hoeflea sp. WL0058]|uniref:GNAT family N-acetyltransferase n=1 Tax=Flavimaribacter sediminis TaxID=2865987 RepID=A0AAE2ZQT8_9HYPH|nr:GNAT family protein [Flavimaribacter sediminis]MBW8639250.1 GNAT family N-acetyltransferase [Flavimaribacter sediminis]
MARNLEHWTGCPRPERKALEGRFARLEPLSAARHGDGLFSAATVDDAAARFTYLPEVPPSSRADFQPWLDTAQASDDPLYFVVIDREKGVVGGRQTLMRITEGMGVIEIGHIYWSSMIARTPVTTEAFFLFARHVFDTLGYRRFEWKCDNANGPSKRAALRFGMTPEGVFRQAAVVKGKNRDTAWFSIIDGEWPVLRNAFEQWLDPANFDSEGRQIRRLEELRPKRKSNDQE